MPHLQYTVGEPQALVRALPNNTLQRYYRITITLASGQTYQVDVPSDGDVVAAATAAVQAKIRELEAIMALGAP